MCLVLTLNNYQETMVQDLNRYPCRFCYDYVQFHGRGSNGYNAHRGPVIQHNPCARCILFQ